LAELLNLGVQLLVAGGSFGLRRLAGGFLGGFIAVFGG